MKILIVTGLSGAGKTQVIKALEDTGYYCVDNMPPELIPKFAEICARAEDKMEHIAVVDVYKRQVQGPSSQRPDR